MAGETEDEFEAELQRAEKEVEEWRQSVEASAEGMRSEHSNLLSSAEDEHARLTRRYEELEAEETEAQRRAESRRKQADALREDVTSAKEAGSHLPEEVQRMEREVRRKEERLKKKEAGVTEESNLRRRSLAKLKEALDAYRERLALRFSLGGDDRLRFELWNIDPADNMRLFTFSLRIISRSPSRFSVVEVDPELPEGRREELEREVNESQNLQTFVVKMRREFRNLVGAI